MGTEVLSMKLILSNAFHYFFHPSTAEKVLLGWFFFIVSLINVKTFVKIWKFRKFAVYLSHQS